MEAELPGAIIREDFERSPPYAAATHCSFHHYPHSCTAVEGVHIIKIDHAACLTVAVYHKAQLALGKSVGRIIVYVRGKQMA